MNSAHEEQIRSRPRKTFQGGEENTHSTTANSPPRKARGCPPKPMDERFWPKVSAPDENGCMNWMAGKRDGYGMFFDGHRKRLATHIALELVGISLPAGQCALHRCDNPSCVNYEHLFVGTRGDNNRDRVKKGRSVYVTGERHGTKTHPERVPRGERSGKAKLTEAKVLEIRRLKKVLRIRNLDLSKMFGVNRPTISKVIHRRLWAHVPPYPP